MSSTLRFELTTPVIDDRPIFVAGNFCDWIPNSDLFRLESLGPGQYGLTLEGLTLPDVIEYKYTKGGWEQVELSVSGEGVPNRQVAVDAGLVQDYVAHWRWFGMPFNPELLPRIELLSAEFAAPQLGTARRIHVLLPHDYERTDKRYPVLYLHDGQNLFGEGAGYGTWAVDQKMALLAARGHHEVILVSIDHGYDERIREFTLHRTRAGKGKGQRYLDFIRRELKPVIDASLRTRPDAAHTGIGGSSLGGLISIYAGLMHPDVFGRLMVFSPSLWISPKIYFDAIQFQAPEPMKVYVYGGEQESGYMVPNIQRLNESLLKQPQSGQSVEVHLSVDPAGTHQEAHWAREFPKAVEWLFY
ncbi:alpha/beta hydrolase [Spirosoma taeanense]|uniref:Alpha/beta hydrolase n=1 Tax=Spirosoma taeanense TaxID=2735870 RepID=A0A6M5Y6L0_9BACT|nr:alpha/beta hydrolase-fold protein [Spirosoma taeanense]QJW90047.1 alpha/beta hydrolase [Spirosoma taeanense]